MYLFLLPNLCYKEQDQVVLWGVDSHFIIIEIQSEIVLKKKIVENDVDGDANRMILMMLK